MTHAVLVVLGIMAGLIGSVAGLASLISYPTLLAFGLAPMSANIANTAALGVSVVGSAIGGRRNLRGRVRRVLLLVAQAALAGAVGALLLLRLPSNTFEAFVPWLVATSAALLLLRDKIRGWAERRRKLRQRRLASDWYWRLATTLTCIYAGYFGAGAGILLVAILTIRYDEPFAVSTAIRNVATGAANVAATCTYVLGSEVEWGAAASLGFGAFVGSWTGTHVAGRLPERPLRYAVAVAGFALAVYLF